MKKIKLIVTDLDFTLLHTDKSITPYTKNVFAKCRDYGIFTAIATARYYIGAEKFINILNPDYEITTDGTMTYKNGSFLYGCGFDLTTTNNIIKEIITVNPNAEITVATDKCVHWNSKHISDSPVLLKAVYSDFTSALTDCAYKIVAMLPNKSIADNIGKKFDCKVISYRGENRYGFINKNAGKIEALHQLAETLHIELSDIISFGDDVNDIDMLTECGYGVAVSNAIDEVKNIARYVTDSNDNDGVALFIDKNILN